LPDHGNAEVRSDSEREDIALENASVGEHRCGEARMPPAVEALIQRLGEFTGYSNQAATLSSDGAAESSWGASAESFERRRSSTIPGRASNSSRATPRDIRDQRPLPLNQLKMGLQSGSRVPLNWCETPIERAIRARPRRGRFGSGSDIRRRRPYLCVFPGTGNTLVVYEKTPWSQVRQCASA
jgi:hypothetical protein